MNIWKYSSVLDKIKMLEKCCYYSPRRSTCGCRSEYKRCGTAARESVSIPWSEHHDWYELHFGQVRSTLVQSCQFFSFLSLYPYSPLECLVWSCQSFPLNYLHLSNSMNSSKLFKFNLTSDWLFFTLLVLKEFQLSSDGIWGLTVPKTDRLIANSSFQGHKSLKKGEFKYFILGVVITKVRVHTGCLKNWKIQEGGGKKIRGNFFFHWKI